METGIRRCSRTIFLRGADALRRSIRCTEMFGARQGRKQKKGEPQLPLSGSRSEPYMSKRLYQSCNCTDTGPAASSVQ